MWHGLGTPAQEVSGLHYLRLVCYHHQCSSCDGRGKLIGKSTKSLTGVLTLWSAVLAKLFSILGPLSMLVFKMGILA